jgi:hypothetical protein
MRPGRIAGWTAAAMLVPLLAACSASSSAGSGTPSTSSTSQATAPAASGGSGSAGGSGGLTPPGTHLGVGQVATVGWVPPSDDSGSRAHKGFKLQITVESIQRGTIADFRNIQLNGGERKSTPYYVKLRITALGSTPPSGTDDPAITLDAIDDRGQHQESITFFGTFQRCNDNTPPKPFASGKSYESCLAYLMPGGGSIQKVQWADGPAAANQVTPYFDHPIVWS